MRLVPILLASLSLAACSSSSPSRTTGSSKPHAMNGGHASMAPHPETRAINVVLDGFHDAASKADLERYFRHFTPDFVFFGTDATERWPLAQFRAFCEPLFSKGKGWRYRPIVRNVFVAPSGNAAWFDEVLENEKYGECRGTGVLVLTDGVWRLSQYNLVIPVPNDFAPEVVRKGREQKESLRGSKPTP